MVVVSTDDKPEIKIDYAKGKYLSNPPQNIFLDEFIDVKGWKALGNKLSNDKILNIHLIPSKTISSNEVNSDPKKPSIEKKSGSANVELENKKKINKSDDQLGIF